MTDQERAIEAFAAMKAIAPIVIQASADFTPAGKRHARLVRHDLNGRNSATSIRWYVGNRAYATLLNTVANERMTQDWLAS
jgi:hypothetical protein